MVSIEATDEQEIDAAEDGIGDTAYGASIIRV